MNLHLHYITLQLRNAELQLSEQLEMAWVHLSYCTLPWLSCSTALSAVTDNK